MIFYKKKKKKKRKKKKKSIYMSQILIIMWKSEIKNYTFYIYIKKKRLFYYIFNLIKYINFYVMTLWILIIIIHHNS